MKQSALELFLDNRLQYVILCKRSIYSVKRVITFIINCRCRIQIIRPSSQTMVNNSDKSTGTSRPKNTQSSPRSSPPWVAIVRTKREKVK